MQYILYLGKNMKFLVLCLLCVYLYADDWQLYKSCLDDDLNACEEYFKTHNKKCENEILESCVNVATLYVWANNFIKKDANKAFKLANKACSSDIMRGCRIAGFIQLEDNNIKDALKLFTKSCDGNDAIACEVLSKIYISGGEVEKDEEKAYMFSKKACEIDDFCNIYATFYYNGIIVEKDWDMAFMLSKKSCDKQDDYSACSIVASIYYDGIIVQRNYHLAFTYAKKACNEADMGDGFACLLLGRLYNDGLGVRLDKQKAKQYIGRACDFGLQEACNAYKNL